MLSVTRACAGVDPVGGHLQLQQGPAARPRHPYYGLCKLAIEWICALVLLAITSPLLAMMAVAAKLSSPGPAFYSQVRLGRKGRPFRIYKIRTMTHNCEAATGAVWSAAGDNRVTKIGRFLRETHLDELPQLWNVLRGQMAMIGPRPERPELVEKLERAIPRYRERLQVRPGLTGLAQMQRPADEDLEDVRHKLAYDIYYVREMSFWLDVRISVSTTLHMTGVALGSMGRLLVKRHGEDAERNLPELPLIEPTQQAGAA